MLDLEILVRQRTSACVDMCIAKTFPNAIENIAKVACMYKLLAPNCSAANVKK